MSGFSCSLPFAVNFQNEFGSFPEGDPKIAAIVQPDFSNRLEYGLERQVCPGKPMKSVQNAVKLSIASKFAKKILAGAAGGPALAAVSVMASQIISDSLSPDALGYDGTREAMYSAIGTAIASGYSCSSIDEASKLFYSYGRDDYIADVCAGKSALSTVLGLLKKEAQSQRIVAVSASPEPQAGFSEFYRRDPDTGRRLSGGEITVDQAKKILVKKLEALPMCHEIVGDYTSGLESLSEGEFFAMYDSILEFLENCPFTFSGDFVLYEVNEHGAFFSDGEQAVSVPKFGIPAEYEKEVLQNFSGPFPVKGEDVFFEELRGENKEVAKAGVESSPLWLLALVPLAFLVYRRMKREKT
jgi:hypothetical protein